jgi:hypothetical protein
VALGGGIPRGRVIEIYGQESCGKTSLALSIMAQAQKMKPNDYVVMVDLEHAYDRQYGARLGLDNERLMYAAPDSGDEALTVRYYFRNIIFLTYHITVVYPKEGHMRVAGQASRSNKFALVWAADNRNNAFLELEGYLRKLTLRVTSPSFGNTAVYTAYYMERKVMYQSFLRHITWKQ